MTTDFKLDAFLPYQLSVLAGRISSAYARHYQDMYGLSRAEWRVMAHLSQESAVSVREIHTRADLDKSKVSRAATRLEKAGIITKHPHPGDGRLVALALTAKGRDMMGEIAPLAHRFQAELIEKLGEDAEPFLRAMHRLSAIGEN